MMEVPSVGSIIQIKSYKHNGLLHRIWQSNFVLSHMKNVVILANDKTRVIESDGRTWHTKEPAIVYFHTEKWFNIIGMIRNDGIHYYCNMSSPFLYENESVKYIDYDLDVKVYPDMTYNLLDEDEYETHKNIMGYPRTLNSIINKEKHNLYDWIRQRKGPFRPGFIDEWYDRYLTYV